MDKVNKIITLLENGQHEEVLKGCRQILEKGSNEERFVLAEELFHYGFIEEAKALIEKLLESYPEEGELLVLLAEALIELGKEDEAILVLERVDAGDPSYPQSLVLLADLYQMQGLFEVSEQKLLNAKALLPQEVLIDFALGELYAEQGKFLEAMRAYERVLTTDEVIAGTNVNQRMAEVLSAGGAFEEALAYYEKALEGKLEINTLFSYALTALQAGYNRTAIEKFTEVLELDPEYHSLYLSLAKAYELEEELDNSFNTVKKGIKQDEFNKDLYLYGARIALKMGKEDEAESLLREALALDPEFIEAALTLTKLLLHQERYEDVLEIIELMNEFAEEEPRFLWDAAIALQELEQYSEALNKYESAYSYYKERQDFLSDYGYFLIEEGKRAEAAELFRKLIKIEPDNLDYQDTLQRLLEPY